MHRFKFWSIAVIISIFIANIANAQTKSDNPRKAYKGWKLVWADEFDGEKVDKTAWRRCQAYTSDWNKHMSNIDTLVTVKDGILSLHAVKTPAGYNDPKGRPYLTGGIEGKGLRSMQLGRFDVRARFDCTIGFWPAIWLMPDNNKPWPNGGEIDIMEHLNFDKMVYQTLHTTYIHDKIEPNFTSGITYPIDPTVYNLYSVIIWEDKIEFFVNGDKTMSYPRIQTEHNNQFPYADHPYYVILSAQLGGSWVGVVDPEKLPVKMDVDYVRFYQKKK